MKRRFLQLLFVLVCGTSVAGCDGSDDDDSAEDGSDLDGDGWSVPDDCDDSDRNVFPGATEICDNVDNDCDGSLDEGLRLARVPDADGDGVGATSGVSWQSPTVQFAWRSPAFFTLTPSDLSGGPPPAFGTVTVAVSASGDINHSTEYVSLWLEGQHLGDAFRYSTAWGSWVTHTLSVPESTWNAAAEDARLELEVRPSPTVSWGSGYLTLAYDGGVFVCPGEAGYAPQAGDCDDGDVNIHPSQPEICGDGVDNNCDGSVDESLQTYYDDADNDSWGLDSSSQLACSAPPSTVTRGGDCDDGDANVQPGATEVCDSVDNDCDGSIDEGLLVARARDADGDGVGVTGDVLWEWPQTSAWQLPSVPFSLNESELPGGLPPAIGNVTLDITARGDLASSGEFLSVYLDGALLGQVFRYSTCYNCWQTQRVTVPAATWNSSIEDGLVEFTFGDVGVGFADIYQSLSYGGAALVCPSEPGYVELMGDCDDSDASVYPGQAEICGDGLDNNCDGSVDENQQLYYEDADNDTWGLDSSTVTACAPAGFFTVTVGGDCNDGDANVNPGQPEVCDNVDNDCDGSTDEGLLSQYWYYDVDNDGYGTSSRIFACQASGYYRAPQAGDCDDGDVNVHPGRTEICDNVDNDCDGSTDEGLLSQYWFDQDNDSYGTSSSVWACQPSGDYTATREGDCNDGDGDVHPGHSEICGNGVDDNCAGGIDENLQLYYEDADGDGWGLDSSPVTACASTGVYTAIQGGDCDDTDLDVNPDADEICDELDNNCDSSIDEGVEDFFFEDFDADSFGGLQGLWACTAPLGYLATWSDCDDEDAAIFPGAVEICDGVDNDCNTQVDEGVTNDCGGCTPFTETLGAACGPGANWTCAADNESLVCPGGVGGCFPQDFDPQDLGLNCGGAGVGVSWLDVQGCTLSTQGDACVGGCSLISIAEDALFLIDGELRLDLSAPPGGCVPSEVEVLEYSNCADSLGYEVTVSLYDAADTLLAEASSPASSSGSTRTILVQASSAAASAAIRTPYGCVRSVTVR